MNSNGAISILEFIIKLAQDTSHEFKITEDPNHIQKLTFFDFHLQITKQISDVRIKYKKVESSEPKSDPDDQNVQDVRPSNSPQ